jgi:hypothetical protein
MKIKLNSYLLCPDGCCDVAGDFEGLSNGGHHTPEDIFRIVPLTLLIIDVRGLFPLSGGGL